MALHASELFERLNLPFADGAVAGDTYCATPVPGSPLRLRISLSPTIRTDEYDGLCLVVAHTERGVLDTATLSFAGRGTFDHRDAALERRPGQSGYAKILDFRTRPHRSLWRSARTSALRTAIGRCTSMWFPGAWTTAAPGTAARTAYTAPAVSPARSSTRTH
ncbi:hypothetical protein [Streptomyces acidiscabies]|uniref:Uncharacterized protein n=1 Tax=Streptomyces acidiscabies TaxID=42234 RepID=A0AAP6BIX6_9ACTN|nr:hypothetical protein [Streptomyces acidiscabies]MBP5935395.1 hypothetical protein [Streptomyces sp. LBUM 1476]MBZ3916756.1 hypothetical protein [Streptomyces acidiscabies]MDX2965606.1 hypothetical protein [Streptomyces acidiscabies]MDX3024892.1 hypothetical protein [Streptomyces acidiscabies]MDX3795522.1 hypothetical protein [Streptomyces acidiscabies]